MGIRLAWASETQRANYKKATLSRGCKSPNGPGTGRGTRSPSSLTSHLTAQQRPCSPTANCSFLQNPQGLPWPCSCWSFCPRYALLFHLTYPSRAFPHSSSQHLHVTFPNSYTADLLTMTQLNIYPLYQPRSFLGAEMVPGFL